MWITIGYILLAIIGLSLIIFVHELGHYLTALRQGMRVEIFSIGFGTPIVKWQWKETQWQVCWLPIGGFVKIAGTESEGDPYAIPDGFFGRPPLARLKVLAMGPIANFIFGIVAFSLIWAAGGRERNFSEYSTKIGWIDPESELYIEGIRPGDQVTAYDNQAIHDARDHLLAPLFADHTMTVSGYTLDYTTGKKTPFALEISPYTRNLYGKKGFKTSGILESASYLIYNGTSSDVTASLPKGSPMEESGIAIGDRLFWVNGTRIFSLHHLQRVLNDNHVLLTVFRNGKVLQRRVPLVSVGELRPDDAIRDELLDWQFEARLQNMPITDLLTIPYNLTTDAVVEERMRFIDEEVKEQAFPNYYLSEEETPLHVGDKIIAVYGQPIEYSYHLFGEIQNPKAMIIVERDPEKFPILPYQQILTQFDRDVASSDLQNILFSLGTTHPIKSSGPYVVLDSIPLQQSKEFFLHPEKGGMMGKKWLEKKKEVEAMNDPELRSQTLALMEEQENQYLLGIPIHDRRVQYNPNPFFVFWDFMREFALTIRALITGNIQPKHLAGPVGIIYLIQDQSREGLKTTFFWLGTLSINIGLLNLLPIPMLDGGTICFTLWEMITGRRLQPKTMERLILPFALALLAFFIFLTYHDLSRLFGDFFSW